MHCFGCGARNFDTGNHYHDLGLCLWCEKDPITLSRRIDDIQFEKENPSFTCGYCGELNHFRGRQFAYFGMCDTCRDDEGIVNNELRLRRLKCRPAQATNYPPGSAGKILAMQERYEQGQELFADGDADMSGAIASTDPELPESQLYVVTPREDDSWALDEDLNAARVGIERDKNRYRARPYWCGRKHNLGSFSTEQEAATAIVGFWLSHFGLFWRQRHSAPLWIGDRMVGGARKERRLPRKRKPHPDQQYLWN